jgi:hypothetical protein
MEVYRMSYRFTADELKSLKGITNTTTTVASTWSHAKVPSSMSKIHAQAKHISLRYSYLHLISNRLNLFFMHEYMRSFNKNLFSLYTEEKYHHYCNQGSLYGNRKTALWLLLSSFILNHILVLDHNPIFEDALMTLLGLSRCFLLQYQSVFGLTKQIEGVWFYMLVKQSTTGFYVIPINNNHENYLDKNIDR